MAALDSGLFVEMVASTDGSLAWMLAYVGRGENVGVFDEEVGIVVRGICGVRG